MMQIRMPCVRRRGPAEYAALDEKALAKTIRQLEKEMQEHARNLEFEKPPPRATSCSACASRPSGPTPTMCPPTDATG
jgi:hypothetical protein